MKADQRYWLIGASEGLGRALARRLDAAGLSLVLSARNGDRLTELAETLDGDRLVLPLDVADSASVAAAARDLPPIDGVVYLAGTYTPMRAQGFDPDKAVAMAEVNFVGALRCLGHVVPGFAARASGHIVLIGSLAGYRGLPGALGYGASKAGLMHLADNLRIDLAHTDIRVQRINPGYIRTRLTAKNDFAMPQMMTPDDAARRVVRAMRKGRFSTAFPAPFAWLFQIAPLLPYALIDRIFSPRPAGQAAPRRGKTHPGRAK